MPKHSFFTILFHITCIILITSVGQCYFMNIATCNPDYRENITPSLPDADVELTSTPVILELTLQSNNLCETNYAIDGDRITCSFTTATPCPLPAFITVPIHNPSRDATNFPQYTASQQSFVAPSSFQLLLLNPQQDYQHWICSFDITHGLFTDQTNLTAYQLLDYIFPDGYSYYGSNPGITYFAPIEFSYTIHQQSLASSSGQLHSLHLTSNHPIQLLTPEYFTNETGHYCSVSIIDAAGNGPLCITIPLEDTEALLYNQGNCSKDK